MKGSKASGAAGSGSSKGESHRIYWQQWPAAATASGAKPSRRDIITGSAAIRISPDGARAQDVTHLLCETLNLNKKGGEGSDNNASPRHESWDKVQDAWERDCLVLVGTLYSLPLHYVRFEHERLDLQQQQSQPQSAKATSETPMEDASIRSSPTVGAKPSISRSDPPFHVIKSLSATDNPIQVRNAMIKHLGQVLEQSTAAALAASPNPSTTKLASSIAPKLQWYFVPGMNHPSSPIPSYIDLDGYSTSMEEEEDDEMDDGSMDDTSGKGKNDPNEAEHDFDPDEILNNLPLSLQEKCQLNETQDDGKDNSNLSSKKSTPTTKERIFKKQRQRYFELSLCQSSLQHDCVSGYLLKQSMTDPHVWKRVHCVLTDDHLWFMSRIYTRCDDGGDTDPNDSETGNAYAEDNVEPTRELPATQQGFYSYAQHRRLELTCALLLQPSKEKTTAPLFRTPFAFEVVDSNGVAHRFRASNADVYKRWVGALKSRIVQSYENSLFEYAQLIVRDETEARSKRFMALVVEPLWENQKASLEKRDKQGYDFRHISMDSPTMKILRFGMEVAEFRERCRHIQAILPAKHPVFAMTKATTELIRSNSANAGQNGSSDSANSEIPSIPSNGAVRLDLNTQALIKGAWDEAIRLGSRAAKITVQLQALAPGSSGGGPSSTSAVTNMPRSLETICQHLEYVITGNFRGAKSRSAQTRRSDNTRQFPPPIDMFDALLAELQTMAAACSATQSSPKHQTESTVTNGGPHPKK